MSNETNLFRFVAVRPVETRNRRRERLRFLRQPVTAEPLTPFQRSLRQAGSVEAARAVARKFIRSAGYVGDRVESDPRLVVLELIYLAMKVAASRGESAGLADRVQAELERVAIEPDVLETVRNDLWDALIAAFLCPREDARDRAGLVHCLRALHYLQARPPIDSPSDLRDLVRATAVIPRLLGSDETSSPTTGTTTRPDPRLQAIRDLRAQVLETDVALDDLDVSYAAARREATQPPTGKRAAAEPPGKEAPRSIPSDTPPRPPWSNTAVVREKLSAATVKLLDGVDPLWSYRPQDQVVERLARHRADATARLERLGGRRAIEGMKTRTNPLAREALSAADLDIPAVVEAHSPFTKPMAGSVGSVRPTGFGDLLIVKDTLLGYEEGEISAIENVMGGETKQRIHRQLDRTSQTTFTSTELSETTERDLETTERYELQSEASETIKNDVAIATGVNVSASYGPMVQTEASADFSVDNSTENSSTTSSNFAQDIVDKSVSKLTQDLKEEITVKVLNETEETTTHGFANSGTDPVVGVYRWLNKLYEAQVFNYGKRLLLEFVIPEPGAFYKFSQRTGIDSDPTLQPPEPLEANFSFLDLDPVGYEKWVDRYQVEGVAPPPPLSRVVATTVELPETLHDPGKNDYVLTTRSASLSIPTGYVAKEAWVQSRSRALDDSTLDVAVGQRWFSKDAGDYYSELDDEETTVPIGVQAYNRLSAVIQIEVRCERTTATLRAWQLETYQKVVDAYNSQQADYEAKLKSQENAQASTLTGLPPDAKRAIEMLELKKGCLELLTGQYFYDFDATVAEAQPFGYPEFEIGQALIEGRYSQFFEQCCEWEQLTYVYYPYFWGRKDEWVANSTAKDSDPIFEAFLRAGAARVQVPVRPGYGRALCYYLQTGEIWNGGEVPLLDDPLYVSIIDEIAESQDVALASATPYGEPWTYSLPTSLVKLQPDATLPTWPATS